MEQVVLTKDELTEIMEMAVRKAMAALGVDTEEPFGMQRDFAFLRATREASDAVKRTSILAIFGAVVVGIAGLVWAKLTGSI